MGDRPGYHHLCGLDVHKATGCALAAPASPQRGGAPSSPFARSNETGQQIGASSEILLRSRLLRNTVPPNGRPSPIAQPWLPNLLPRPGWLLPELPSGDNRGRGSVSIQPCILLVAPVPIVVRVCRCCDDASSFCSLLSRETLAVSSQATCGLTAQTGSGNSSISRPDRRAMFGLLMPFLR
jgi:hypothetical protein